MDTFAAFARTAVRVIAPLLALASLTAWGAHETRWTFVELHAPSANFTLATAVNNRGEVAGWYNAPCPERFTCERPFVWDGGFRTLPTPPDVSHVRVRGINDSGTVVGHSTLFGLEAIAWTNGQFSRLGFEGEAIRINRAGDIACTARVGGFPRACLLRDGVLFELGAMGGQQSFGVALNNRGKVLANADPPDGTRRTFTWDNGTVTDLGSLGGSFTFGNAINDRGVVVGYSQDETGQTRPFRWSDGVMTALPPASGTAQNINDRGAIIGISNGKAYLLDDGVLTILDDLPEVRAKGFTGLIPVDINERGWIVGWGNTPAGQRGFLLIAK